MATHLSTLSLCNSTLTQAHERARSISLSPTSTSTPSADRALIRNLVTLASRASAFDADVNTSADSRRQHEELGKSIRTLVGVLEQDARGKQMVEDVRQTYPSFGLPESSATSARFPSTGLTRTSARPSTDEPYRDSHTPEPQASDAELLSSQQQVFTQQDQQLDHLSQSINRQRDLSLQMNDELELHAGLLDDLDASVENTGLRLGRAGGMLTKVEKSLKEHGSTWTIFGLIVILVILIAVFK